MPLVIESVIGFNLDIVIRDQNDKPILTGVKTTLPDYHATEAALHLQNTHFFTNFDHRLLAKIRDYKSRNL
jgi:hypothetical protein